jgi:hypothetical protein
MDLQSTQIFLGHQEEFSGVRIARGAGCVDTFTAEKLSEYQRWDCVLQRGDAAAWRTDTFAKRREKLPWWLPLAPTLEKYIPGPPVCSTTAFRIWMPPRVPPFGPSIA